MITIAHITAPGEFGGLERVVGGLARATAARGHRVILVTVLDQRAKVPVWAEALADAGIIVEPVWLPGRAYLAERRAVRAILERHAVQVIHTHGYRCDVVHRSTARSSRLPQLSTVHGFTHLGWKGRFFEWLQLRALRHVDAVVAVSAPLKSRLREEGIPADSLHQIVNGLVAHPEPPLTKAAARERLGVDAAKRVVGWVGRLSAEKGPDLLIRAASELPDSTVVVVLGDGPERSACEATAQMLGISHRVKFLGAVRDAPTLFPAFDALLVSSRTEGTPMVVLEAATAGVPVVAFAVGGLPDLLGGERGWLVEPENTTALAAACTVALGDDDQARTRATALLAHLHSAGASTGWIDDYLALYSALTRKTFPAQRRT